MKKAFGLIFTLALLASTAHAATVDPTGSSKTPEQVADLYIASSWGNMDKAKELNDYLLPHYVGKNKPDVLAIAEDTVKKYNDYSSLFSQNAAPDTDPDVTVLYAALMTPLLHATCHATGSTIHAGDNGGSPVATVAYECHMPDIKKIIATLPPDRKLSRKEADTILATIKAAPADMVVTDTVDLNADAAHHIWFNDNADHQNFLPNVARIFISVLDDVTKRSVKLDE